MANKYFREALIPSAATETTLYTVPTDSAAVARSLRVTNADAAAAAITVVQYSSGSATAHYLLKSRNLSINATYDVLNGVPLVLEGGDTLKVTSSIASVHFYLSYLEMDRT
jgi:hypothetical protein